MHTLNGDRRESPRVQTVLYVRGLGTDDSWSQQLGNLGVGGVGVEYPRSPEAETYEVCFSLPGENSLRTATASLVNHRRQQGGRNFFLGLKFREIHLEDELALARSLDKIAERAREVFGDDVDETLASNAVYSLFDAPARHELGNLSA